MCVRFCVPEDKNSCNEQSPDCLKFSENQKQIRFLEELNTSA